MPAARRLLLGLLLTAAAATGAGGESACTLPGKPVAAAIAQTDDTNTTACQAACAEHPNCQFFSLCSYGPCCWCSLYATLGGVAADSGCSRGPKRCPNPAPPKPDPAVEAVRVAQALASLQRLHWNSTSGSWGELHALAQGCAPDLCRPHRVRIEAPSTSQWCRWRGGPSVGPCARQPTPRTSAPATVLARRAARRTPASPPPTRTVPVTSPLPGADPLGGGVVDPGRGRVDSGMIGCASRAVQFHPHGGQFDFVWLPARTPHVGPQ